MADEDGFREGVLTVLMLIARVSGDFERLNDGDFKSGGESVIEEIFVRAKAEGLISDADFPEARRLSGGTPQ